jgi:flagellar biosynthesis protein FlhB
MAGGNDNRTEQPTRRKLEKAREKGQVARSKEVPSAAVLFGGLVMLFYFGQTMQRALEFELRHLLSLRMPSEISISYLSGFINGIGLRVAMVLFPFLLVLLAFSIAGNLFQGGLIFSAYPLGFHFNKLNPQNGLGRIFSKNGIVELLKSLLLLSIVSIISYQVIVKHLALYPKLILMDVRKLFHWTVFISFEIFIRVAILLIIMAIADYFFQKHRFTEQHKMTKQEVKDEFKEMEGDPTTKGRIRRIQREMARKRMMADVPAADVIITNPTHYAVALSYKMESMDAPKVVAKGVGFLALKIKELAQEHGIPLVENKPLAQTLYKTVEIGAFIPGNLYKAVAEILAYVYKAKNALYR